MSPDQLRPFGSLYSHGFARVAAGVPHMRIADPSFNAERTIALARQASEDHAVLVVFPELGLSGYSIDDLLHQGALLDAVEEAIGRIVAESASLEPIVLVGAPLRCEHGVFNCAVVIHRGRVLGAVPKSYLPEYKEYYEKRQFRAARDAVGDRIRLGDELVPFGADLLFCAQDLPGFVLHVEVCEDLWVPIPPSTFGALAGATVLANLSASNITIGKAVFRRTLCSAQSARTIAAYVYTAAGMGESTTDLAWDGQAIIFENGDQLTEAERFSTDEQLIAADIDLDRLAADRASTSSYGDSIHDHRDRLASMRQIDLELGVSGATTVPLRRRVERFPYVPADPVSRNERCEEVYNIQVRGLETRLEATSIKKIVIGVSGGLDSTHALIVAARAMDRLGLSRENVLAYTMPGFATGQHTLRNAHRLMETLGVSSEEMDIRPAATQMLRDLRHPAAEGAPEYDVTYENIQAGERTSHLFRLANYHGGLVLGTGDLSELALGWATYGVGDQMSHYHVNASVPKTLIQFMVRWAIDTDQFGGDVNDVLDSVLNTEISPELVPSSGENGDELQGSEKVVGPYELQDFFLYYILRFGYSPGKVAFLALHAWGDRTTGSWPDLIPEERRGEYSLEEIKHWLGVFLERFFHISQFKRSAMPNAPKVGSGGSLSPRGDWRAPSDGSATTWLEQLQATVPDRL
ncbi:MAG TPA: NAD(+) synthase [Solirubrobacteraceae bacterium]|nr:NAD(+) synthase [Solirubrobacteraceae bacterium]